jgi:hypothetical protein
MQSGDTTPAPAQAPTHLERPYTVVLFALGAVALFNVFSLQFSADIASGNTELTSSQFQALIRFAQATALFLAAAYFAVGILRVRSSSLAPSATALLSVVSLLVFPFGTAAFVYWVGWVRKRERTWLPPNTPLKLTG